MLDVANQVDWVRPVTSDLAVIVDGCNVIYCLLPFFF